ncbi:MAG: SPOR domain-containing protein [Candidatus Kapaibacterium sp.]
MRHILITLSALFLCSTLSTFAQNYEQQALDILKLYEKGERDTAYWLVEPLKRNARFVPAALYVRAQMTADDRALNLYREVIALEPAGPWADESAYQLVRRYVEKRDSLASWTWYTMLKKTYPQSPYVSKALSIIQGVESWEFTVEDEGEEDSPQSSSGTDVAIVEEEEDEQFKGYALQVGLFPTEEAAERRVKELQKKGVTPFVFPKEINGKTQYALVVGPYDTREEATKAKPNVAKVCECGAFTVLVE